MGSTQLAKQLGIRIRQLRIQQGITSQEQLGELAGLHRTFVGRVERGETNVTLDTLYKLAAILEVTLGQLFTSIEEKHE